ncbi:hypothetical protein H6F43_06920 [Leptolyngbya sp. FACHB-36]|uniref:hypothetical protein n=1 Tax=Leptolyngbya sp. FACHB-36 TaxID=2692808 RepID=UPI001680FD9F|nr:hypothetical protein [Leptolyngbya sp. FACHB-36]MBD2019918.1 hypothetical protein [Leptolyngbya sp. FACHB-36]
MSTNDTLRSLVDMAGLQNRSIERLRDSVEELRNLLGDSNNRLIGSIDALTVQVGSFASSMNELKGLMRQLTLETQQQNEVAKRQAENIAELIQLANRLLERN